MAVELAGSYPDSPMMDDEQIYPCKGCGEILEEGKAFELAGNRWHIDCFRCNTCGTLLDSDANLLLLGDGSLICNNCTYSCSACGNKIEDLAILTGDQAFCASCFRCRNCKRKIENLRYARTSQGIFCMSCHESLMAKRRKHKKQRANGLNKDKSLPDLPPGDPNRVQELPGDVFEMATPANDLPNDPLEEPELHRRSKSSRKESRDLSSGLGAARRDESNKDALTLPASTYGESSSKSKSVPVELDSTPADDGLFVPFLLDTSPAIGTSPFPDNGPPTMGDSTPTAAAPAEFTEQPARDPLTRKPAPTAPLRTLPSNSSRPSSADQRPSSPLNLRAGEKPRVNSSSGLRQGETISESSSYASTPVGTGAFKLQEAPKTRRNESGRDPEEQLATGEGLTPLDSGNVEEGVSPFDEGQGRKDLGPLNASYSAGAAKKSNPSLDMSTVERPARGDSLNARKDLTGIHTTSRKQPDAPSTSGLDRSALRSGEQLPVGAGTSANDGKPPIAAPVVSRPGSNGASGPPARSSSRPAGSAATPIAESFTSPRAAPAPPTQPVPQINRHRPSESTSTLHSETSIQMSPVNLPRYSTGGDFTMNEDMDRILKGDGEQPQGGVLRKMSNAVKGHGRSFSDRSGGASANQTKWTAKSPLNGVEISSPTAANSPESRDEVIMIKQQLRRAQQRIAELEARNNAILHQSADFSEVDSKLKEKRSTMAFLETQRELVVRELEVMTENLKKAKDSNRPLDLKALKIDVLADLTDSVKELKDSLAKEIEGLMQKRDAVTNEISDLIAMKDKGIQEYESLSSRNLQLTQHNNELIHNIQDFYKANRSANGGSFDGGRPTLPNGLGIQMHSSHKSEDSRQLFLQNENSMPNLMQEHDADGMISTPQVINIKRPKKANMLKKGTQGFLRGARGIFASEQERAQERDYLTAGVPYNQMSDGRTPQSNNSASQQQQKYGFFGNEKQGGQKLSHLKHGHSDSSNPNLIGDAGAGAQSLFGGDLTMRCDAEKRLIPLIVAKCIEEVELRGMEVEGIYRKSGGSGQVNTLKAGFESDSENFDISDQDLDIHAITSTLKQYFRRLPIPLITYDVYDSLLEAVRVEDVEKRTIAMKECIEDLPKSHRECLEFLIFHLSRVMDKAQYNLMTPLNLAVVFAPTVLRPQSIEREMTDMQVQRNAIQFMLENSKVLFAED